jgi:hypothetical protein
MVKDLGYLKLVQVQPYLASIATTFNYGSVQALKQKLLKARAHKGGVRIGKTPKKLASICCP